VRELSRANVRQYFERRFTAARMARDYVSAYEALLAGASVDPRRLIAA
jgi:hypothetical protein